MWDIIWTILCYWFIFLAGAMTGIFVAGLMQAAKRGDEHIDNSKQP